MRFVVFALMMTIGAANATACPPRSGSCKKYRRLPIVVELEVALYRRAVPAPAPMRFDRRSLESLLTASSWIPIGTVPLPQRVQTTIAPPTLRFVLPSNARRTSTGDRVVLIRQLEQRAGSIYVEIEGVFFAVQHCGDSMDGRANTTCLRRVGTLPVDSTGGPQQFATPP